MPKPKGWSQSQLTRRDRCVEHLKAQGRPESRAYAICTAAISGASRVKKKR
jgi:hypothetical protein